MVVPRDAERLRAARKLGVRLGAHGQEAENRQSSVAELDATPSRTAYRSQTAVRYQHRYSVRLS